MASRRLVVPGRLRVVLRSALRRPAVTWPVVTTVALGVGSVTLAFSLLLTAVLRPLPFPDADDIWSVWTTRIGTPGTQGVSSDELRSLADMDGILAAAGTRGLGEEAILLDAGDAVAVSVSQVTEGFLDLFGLPPQHGRFFSRAEHSVGQAPIVVLSDRVWRTQFGAEPAIVGTTIRFARLGPATVIGVAPAILDVPRNVDVWTTPRVRLETAGHSLEAFIRLSPELADAGRAALDRVSERPVGGGVAAGAGYRLQAQPLIESMLGPLAPTLVAVFGCAVLVLFLGAVNVSILILAQSRAGHRELALRMALGATRGDVMWEQLSAVGLLSAVGTLLGFAAAYAGLRIMPTFDLDTLPRLGRLPGGYETLPIALLVGAGAFVLLIPVLGMIVRQAAATGAGPLRGSLNEGIHRTRRLLAGLLAVEFALALLLASTTGSLVAAYLEVQQVDLGYSTSHRIAVTVLPPTGSSTNRITSAWLSEIAPKIRSLPGVTASGAGAPLPLSEDGPLAQVAPIGLPALPGGPPPARLRVADAGFFSALGISVRAAPGFPQMWDDAARPLAIVNRLFVEQNLGGRQAMGQAVQVPPWYGGVVTIVGVVDDVRQTSPYERPQAAVYLPLAQVRTPRLTFVVSGDSAHDAALKSAVRTIISSSSMPGASTIIDLDTARANAIRLQRLITASVLAFGFVATLLASAGVYSVARYASVQRRHELAIRSILGASPARLGFLLVRELGAFAGLAIAAAAGSRALVDGLLVAAVPGLAFDATLPFVLGTLVLCFVALLAISGPLAGLWRLNPQDMFRHC